MANALFVDALKGYEFYLSKRGKVDLNQVNEFLLQNGRNPIAHRTYTHYNKLLQNGFRNYIPINKFDVFQAIGKIQIAADRRRYKREAAEINIQFSRDGKRWTQATIIDRSIVGFGILFQSKYPTRTGISGWIRLDGYYDIPVVVVWKKHEEDVTRIGVRAMEFVAKYRTQTEEFLHRSVKLLRIQHIKDDMVDWDNFYEIITKVDELIKSTADLIYSLEDIYEVETQLRRSVLKYIKFSSPGDTSIKVDFGIGDIIKIVIEKIQFWGLQKRKMRAEVEAQELNNEAVALANANLEVEMIRNAVKLGKEIQDAQLTDEIVIGLKELIPLIFGVRKSDRDTFTSDTLEFAILTERIIPAALGLIAGDDADYVVKVEEE